MLEIGYSVISVISTFTNVVILSLIITLLIDEWCIIIVRRKDVKFFL